MLWARRMRGVLGLRVTWLRCDSREDTDFGVVPCMRLLWMICGQFGVDESHVWHGWEQADIMTGNLSVFAQEVWHGTVFMMGDRGTYRTGHRNGGKGIFLTLTRGKFLGKNFLERYNGRRIFG